MDQETLYKIETVPTEYFGKPKEIQVRGDPRQLGIYKELEEKGLSQERAKQLRLAISAYIDDNFERGRGNPKYGNLTRAFNKEQLIRFFSTIRNPIHKFQFVLQFFYGLRISEIQNVTPVWEQGLLRIENKKCNRVEYLPLYKPIRAYLWTKRNYFDIKLNPNYMAKRFRMYRSKHKELSYVYEISKHGYPLYQFTTHTLRHTAINFFRKSVKDPYIVSLFSRHKPKELGVMSTYYHHSTEELRSDLEKCFSEFKEILDENI